MASDISFNRKPGSLVATYEQRARTLLSKGEISKADYLSLCRLAVEIRLRHPLHSPKAAEFAASCGGRVEGAANDRTIRALRDLMCDLELPDSHVQVSPGSSVDDRWQLVQRIIDNSDTR